MLNGGFDWPPGTFGRALALWLALAAITFVALLLVPAHYGRYGERRGRRGTLPARWGWLIMEAPAALVLPLLFVAGANRGPAEIAFVLLWLAHYLDRAFLYPFRLRADGRRMPVEILLMAILFNVANGWLNGHWLFSLAPPKPAAWLRDPRFLAGAALFAAGWWINRWADGVLRGLRRPGEREYRVPEPGLYRWVSCPNYLGEILLWCGWALATWSPPGLAFALWTIANLAPRARSHHAWYRSRFPAYPPRRRALLPFLW